MFVCDYAYAYRLFIYILGNNIWPNIDSLTYRMAFYCCLPPSCSCVHVLACHFSVMRCRFQIFLFTNTHPFRTSRFMPYKGPRWASWNLGVFLCIRCAGIHRNLGVHISRVKSVNLDSWTPEQVVSLQQMGNSRARAVYEAQLPDGFRRPQTDSALESFIRAKYEHKKYVAREWVQPPPVKANWDKEIEEEMEKQKRKKRDWASHRRQRTMVNQPTQRKRPFH